MNTWPYPCLDLWENTTVLSYNCDNGLNTWIPDTWIPGTKEEEEARVTYLTQVYQTIQQLEENDQLERAQIINNRIQRVFNGFNMTILNDRQIKQEERQSRSFKNRLIFYICKIFPCI